ncbi:unnamed protein product [Nippostrongylus brasiliensis]|uniref:CCHC-type domain-containing protein n=1 Tax=Nippostrongylus brasiliensis TaxID=27835 RepID=A0A0N4YKS1_NIPBR|nr:unnamed protein product [Nippostrongylus brasiliensis]
MATTLATRQGILTRTTGCLAAILDDVPNQICIQPSTDSSTRYAYVHDKKYELLKLKRNLESASAHVDKALQAYTQAADGLESDTPQFAGILEKVSANSAAAQELLIRAQTSLTEVDIAIEELSMASPTLVEEETPPVQLAPLPIPKFSGKVWEWENFWSIFDYSVHSRNIADIHKMNYLTEALQGEARRAVQQFQVSGSSYMMAIDHLKRKYGNPQLLLNELAGRLEKCHACSRRIEDQRTLYEEVSSIINQMKLKGESIDNILLQKQVLSKFSEPIQRHVLRKKQKQANIWTTSLLLSHVCDFIDTEVEIQRQVDNNKNDGREMKQRKSISPTPKRIANKVKTFICFFCEKTGHSPRNCPEYTTREQRVDHMKRNCLCLNYGEPDHRANQCSKGACKLCNKVGHHPFICRQTTPFHEKEPQSATEKKTPTITKPSKPLPRRATRQNFVSSAVMHNLKDDDTDVNDDIETLTRMKSTDTSTSTKMAFSSEKRKSLIRLHIHWKLFTFFSTQVQIVPSSVKISKNAYI